MPVVSKSLTDAIKQILQSLQLSYLFPAAVLVVFSLLLFPSEINMDEATVTVLAISGTILLSYLLYSLNIPIIRIAEGYILEESWFFKIAHDCEKKRFDKLQSEINKCNRKITDLMRLQTELEIAEQLTPELRQQIKETQEKWLDRRRPLLERLELRYPSLCKTPMPTQLGNTIAAFEEYPWKRYCMDAVHLWPRLIPVLEEKKFLTFVQTEKSVFDFLLNIVVVIVLITFEMLFIFAVADPAWKYLIGILVLLAIGYCFYIAANIAAQHWGGMVKVAFDLYREDLRKALYLPPIPEKSLGQERDLWHAVSEFLVFGVEPSFGGFSYALPISDDGKEKTTCTT